MEPPKDAASFKLKETDHW